MTPAEQLQRFGAAILREHYANGEIDDTLIEQMAVEAGVLEWVTATEPCGTECVCARVSTLPQECLHIPADVYAASVIALTDLPGVPHSVTSNDDTSGVNNV